MKCDCCGVSYDIMYRTLDTRVYCLHCSRRDKSCCYGKAVVPTRWFRVEMAQRELESLEVRGHEHPRIPGAYQVQLTPKRKKKEVT